MKSFPRPGAIAWAFICAVAVSLPFFSTAGSRRDDYFFEIRLASSQQGIVQLFYDVGRGFNEDDSAHQWVNASGQSTLIHLGLPPGRYQSLRFDPLDREAVVTMSEARIMAKDGTVIRRFAPGQFEALNQIARLVPKEGGLEVHMVPGANDSNLGITLDQPFVLGAGAKYWSPRAVKVLVGVFGFMLALSLLPGARIAAAGRERIMALGRAHPVRVLFVTAVASVAVQCHPVLFFGRSFVSPNSGVYLLYDTFPTLPGYQSTDLEDARGADVGAIMWCHLYAPVLERTALFTDGELPLWNRDNLNGVPLLGQGQTMFGDPLNWLTIFANGASWAWDARFLAVRMLFAFGTGLAVWLLARQLAAAVLSTISVVFIGFFAFRFNHPAILSVCWSPWVLVAWCWLLEARTPRARNLSLLTLLAAHVCLMTSGTIKEAYMLAACLDLAGVLLLLLAAETWPERGRKLGAAGLTGLVFILVTAPQWITFLGALGKSHTYYDVPGAAQLPPWQGLGFFEDLFYRQFRAGEAQFEPSANFVILFGLLWALAGLRENLANRRFLAVLLAALVPCALVFGFVPARWIVRLPFLRNIIHIDNTFSCPLLVLGAVLAGLGLAACIRGLRQAGWMTRYAIFALLLGGMAAWYFRMARHADFSPFFAGYAPSLLLVILACPVFTWLAARRQSAGAAAAIVAVGLVLLLWRHGQYLATPFDAYVMNPKERVDLAAPSAAVNFVSSHMQEPSRPVGLGYNLFPGFNQRLGWESIYGVDALRSSYVDELARLTPMNKIIDWVGGPVAQEDIGKGLPMQDLMNVRYYLATHRATARELPGRQPVASLDLDVFESPTAWPRAFFTDTLRTYQAADDFVRLTMAGDGRPFAVVQEADVRQLPGRTDQLPDNLAARQVAPAHDYQLTANTTSFTVSAADAGVIVLTESYYPGDFEVTVNDEPAPYFRVNHAFKGVYVPRAGTYRVSFRYWPEHLTLSLWLCAGGLLLAAALLFLDAHLRRAAAPAR